MIIRIIDWFFKKRNPKRCRNCKAKFFNEYERECKACRDLRSLTICYCYPSPNILYEKANMVYDYGISDHGLLWFIKARDALLKSHAVLQEKALVKERKERDKIKNSIERM